MIDHILGRPSPTWKRAQVVLILLFWTSVLFKGPPNGPTRLVQRLSARFKRWTPWQIIVATLTAAYATKNAQHLLSLNAPEPLARLYSRSYYRATYVATALDAGFATAMNIRPKPLRDLLSVLFSGYYLLFANDADEKMRKYRALCSVEMLRATWNKTDNPLLRLATARHRPKVAIHRKLELRRPKESKYTKPIVVHLFFDGSEEELREADELVTDIPGGGFCAMSPTAHEERLLRWAKRIKRPVASVDYSKAPEHPYPYAIDEIVDLYRLLTSTQGAVVGLGGRKSLKMVWTGDSAGANIATAALFTRAVDRTRCREANVLICVHSPRDATRRPAKLSPRRPGFLLPCLQLQLCRLDATRRAARPPPRRIDRSSLGHRRRESPPHSSLTSQRRRR